MKDLNIDLNQEDDETLILYISDREENERIADEAFKEFYQRYSHTLWEICSKICSRLVEGKGAEDLMSQVFRKVYYNAASFNSGGCTTETAIRKRIKGWLFKIAQNQFRDWIKTDKKKKVDSYSPEEFKNYLDDLGGNQEEIIKRSEESIVFEEVWDTMSEREQDVLRLSYLYYDVAEDNHRMPSDKVEELAEFHNVTKVYIRKIRQRALEKLKKRCKEKLASR